MSVYFTDSSAVVKRYVQEIGSAWVDGLFTATPSNMVVIVATTSVEVVAAITRRARGGTISQVDAASSSALFLADLSADYRVVPVTDALLREAIRLAQLYGLRGYDAVQLAAGGEANRLRVAAGLSPLFSCLPITNSTWRLESRGLWWMIRTRIRRIN